GLRALGRRGHAVAHAAARRRACWPSGIVPSAVLARPCTMRARGRLPRAELSEQAGIQGPRKLGPRVRPNTPRASAGLTAGCPGIRYGHPNEGETKCQESLSPMPSRMLTTG